MPSWSTPTAAPATPRKRAVRCTSRSGSVSGSPVTRSRSRCRSTNCSTRRASKGATGSGRAAVASSFSCCLTGGGGCRPPSRRASIRAVKRTGGRNVARHPSRDRGAGTLLRRAGAPARPERRARRCGPARVVRAPRPRARGGQPAGDRRGDRAGATSDRGARAYGLEPRRPTALEESALPPARGRRRGARGATAVIVHGRKSRALRENGRGSSLRHALCYPRRANAMVGDPLHRIAYVIGELDKGGAEYQLYELLRHLDRRRFAPGVFVLAPGGWWVEPIRALGVPVEELPRRGSADVRRLARLRAALQRFAPHLLHTILWSGNSYGRLAALGLGIPVVIGRA